MKSITITAGRLRNLTLKIDPNELIYAELAEPEKPTIRFRIIGFDTVHHVKDDEQKGTLILKLEKLE